MPYLIGLVALVVVVGVWMAGSYNALVRLRNLVLESWRQIDDELSRRHELIPNLVETVNRHTGDEQQPVDDVVRARVAALASGPSIMRRAAEEGALSAALGRLFSVAQGHRQLTVDEEFRALQGELTDTERRVAAGRRFYNANVRELNAKIQTFPGNVVAGLFGIAAAESFDLDGDHAGAAAMPAPGG